MIKIVSLQCYSFFDYSSIPNKQHINKLFTYLNLKQKSMTSNKHHKKQKSIEEYRRDIFALKGKLKSEQEYLNELKQKYADRDILSDKSYTFSMKLKILQYTLNDIRAKIAKFSGEQAYEYYCLNFSVFALVKSCQIIGMTKEMIFRGIDHELKGQIGWFDLSNFLKEVMRLDSQFIIPIMKVISLDESKPITKERYDQFLASFMLKSEQNGQEIDNLDQAIYRVAKEMIKQKVDPQKLWTQKEVNIAVATHGLMKEVKFLDVLDCVAVYCKCDPLKSGVINTSAVVNLLKQRINDSANFSREGAKIKLAKN